MSKFDEELEKALAEEEEKRKKKKLLSGISVSPTYSTTKDLTAGKLSYLPNYNNIAPVVQTTARDDEEDLAPVRKTTDKGLDFFQKSSVFDDGYNFGDITKTILGTAGDAVLGAAKGVASLGEGLGDLVSYGIAGVGDALGKDTWASGVRKRAQENLVDSLTKKPGNYLDQYSVLGRTSDSILQGIGQVGGIMATGGIGSAAGLGAGGVTALTTGTMGLSSMGSGMGEAYKGGATDEEAVTYGLISGAADSISELIFGGLGKTVNALGFNKGLSSLDDMFAKKISSKISKQIAKNFAEFGVKATAEGLEEVIAGTSQALGKKLTYLSEEEFGDILKDENLLEQFVVGALTSGMIQSGIIPGTYQGSLIESNKKKTDFITGFSQNEQAVIRKETENRIAEAEKNGEKLSAKEKSQIEAQVEKDLESGYISTDTIESVLAGDSQKAYDSLLKESEEFNTLYETEGSKLSEKQKDRLAELKQKNTDNPYETALQAAKEKISQDAFEIAKGDRLAESYFERERKKQAFTADTSQYKNENARQTVQNVIDSGISNNTKKFHSFVDLMAKVSEEKGLVFNVTNAQKLQGTKYMVDGKAPNGFIEGNQITINLSSPKNIDFIAGHEITHSLEQAGLYKDLQKAVEQYARTKGEYDSRLASLTARYEGKGDPSRELVADMIGDYVFTDADFVRNLSVSHRNVFQKIYDEIKYLWKVATAGSKEARELERVKKLFEEAYREGENARQSEEISDSKTKYSIREEEPPKNTGVAYKVFYVKDGKLYPPMVANPDGADTPMGVWLNADVGTAAPPSKTGRAQVKAGGKGTQGGSGSLAFRPGWHLGDLPRASQFDRVNPETGQKELFPENFVWAEVEYAKDVDYQEEAMSYGYTDNGKFRHAYAGLPRLPENGYYRYRTNPKPDTVPWVITGAMKVNRLLSDAEVNEILQKNGVDPVHRQGGDVGLDKFGFQEDGTVKYSLPDTEGRQLSAEQQEYFKDSVVRDKNGSLKVMYHGTSKGGFTVFDTYKSKYGLFGTGFYFTDSKNIGESYTEKGKGKNPQVYKAYLNIKNPLDMDAPADPAEWSKAFDEVDFPESGTNENFYRALEEYYEDQQIAKWEVEDIIRESIEYGMGYDGITHMGGGRVNPDGERHRVYIAFQPEQIKNTDNAKPTENPDIRYSLSEDSNMASSAVAMNTGTKAVSNNVMNEAIGLREEVAARLKGMKENGVAIPEDMKGNTAISNSSYDITEENTTICPRSLAAEAFTDAVSEYLGRPLTVQEQIFISQDLQGRSLTPECTYCYVATDRKAYRAFLGEYITQRDAVLQKVKDDPNADVSRSGSLYKEFLNGRKDTNPAYNRFKMWVDTYKNGKPMVEASHLANINKLMGDIGSEFGAELKPQITDAMKYAQSASWAKKRVSYVSYDGHILKWNQSRIDKLNSHYGLRMYSFSDFHPAFVLENMQMITDASVRGLKMLGYTKDTDFVEIFAPSGMNINVSTFGFETGGNVYENNIIGANWDKAKALREQYPNVGITFVATNDNLVNWALEQDWIDVVIPYHLVRTGAEVAKAFKYTNYTSESADKKTKDWSKGDKKYIAPTEHNNDKATYLAALEKNHLKPRFERFIDNPNYMKLVNECRQAASEVKPVQPVFNRDAAMVALAKLEANGYYQPVGGSVDRMYEIAAQVAEDMTNAIAPVGGEPTATDINYSIQGEGKRGGHGEFSIPAREFLREQPTEAIAQKAQAEIAPVKTEAPTIAENATVSNMESVAPVVQPVQEELFPDSSVNMESLLEEQDGLRNALEAAADRGDYETMSSLTADYEAVTKQIQQMQASEDDRISSLSQTDAPPEVDAPYPGESGVSPAADPFADRDMSEVGNRSVKAYQYENPEVRPYFMDAALGMLGDLHNGVKGERWFNDDVYYESGGEKGFGGTKRQTTADIAELLDQWNYSYAEIEKGLNAIIEDNGKENNACSKRIEFMLHDRLVNGYTGVWGEPMPANQEYINFLEEKQINEYSQESFAKFMETADQYAPPAQEEAVPVKQDIAPTAPLPYDLKGAMKGQETHFTQDYNLNNRQAQQGVAAEDIAPLYDAAARKGVPEGQQAFMEDAGVPKTVTRKELHAGIIDNIKASFAQKGFNFDEVLKKAKNLSTFATVDNTPQRVMEKALGYKEGGILSDITVNKVAQNETEGIRWLNSFTDRKNGLLASISRRYNIKPGSKESAAAQMYAEGFYVNEQNEIISYGDKELAADFPDTAKQAQIKGLASDPRIRKIYDDTLKAINESRTRNAYPEIPRLDNYFLHFRAMEDTFSTLGLPFNPNDIRAKDLPTDLNGVTADLKPGQPYFASAQHRTGKRTSFDLLGGLERYLNSAKNQIYHIDDIQNLRALRNYIADTYGQANGLEGLDALSEEAQQERIEQVYGSHLSTFAKFLNEEANVIAGKTALIDRGLEGVIGRRGMTFLDTVNRQVGANMVGYNVSSSLTNFLAPVQAFAKSNKAAFIKGMAQFASNKVRSVFGSGDGFAEQSPVMIRRKGAERFHRTLWQKMSDPGYILMGAVDNVSTELIARAKYNELVGKGMDSQQAHIETDKWVSRLMGDRSLGQQPQLFNSKTLGIVTKFQLEVRNQLDSQFYDTIQETKVSNEYIQNALLRNAKTAAKVTSTFVQLAVAQHLFGKAFESIAGYNPAFDIISAIIKTFGWDDDEESEDTVLDNIEQGFFELMEDMPYYSVMTGGRIPIESALPVDELFKGKDSYGNEKSRWETLAEAAPYYFLPGGYGQLKKTTAGLKMFGDEHPVAGSYTDSGNLRFPVEDTLANRAQAAVFGQWASDNARYYFDNEISPLKEKQIQEYMDTGMPIRDYWDYREGLKGLDNLSEQADYINSLDVPIATKNTLINNLTDRKEPINLAGYDNFGSFEEFDFATKNPEKYEIAQAVGGYESYATFQDDMKNMKLEEKVDYVAGLNLTTEQKNILINGETDRKKPIDLTGYENFGNFEEFEYAKENPEKYAVAKSVGGYEAYKAYSGELYDIKADKDENGKSISGSRKEKVLDYINGLDIDYGMKLILFKNEYNADDTYNYEIVQYLDSREDISWQDMKTILTKLGFTVHDDGRIEWD